jgi:hypothetical protein
LSDAGFTATVKAALLFKIEAIKIRTMAMELPALVAAAG